MPAFKAHFLAAVLAGFAADAAAAPAAPQFAPNPAVGWIALGTEFTVPASGVGPVQQDPKFPRITNEDFRRTGQQPTLPMADLASPILQPWTKEELRKHNLLIQSGRGGLSRQASCWSTGVPGFDLYVIHPIFFVQGEKEVLMVWQGDHQVRHVYLNQPHSPHPKPSWFGESVGHYEGDTLVVDTIGLNTNTYVDNFYTPHSDKLHVTERYRMLNGGKNLEARIHVEDPGAFTMPWDAMQRYRRVEPGVAENDIPVTELSSSAVAGPILEMSCAENPGAYFGNESIAIPQAARADF